MKTFLVVVLLTLALSCGQDTEQDINAAIMEELQGYLNKDFELWSKHWVKSDQTRYVRINANSYLEVVSWDSLQMFFQGHFQTAPVQGYDQLKYDFDIQVEGNLASVYYLSKSIKPTLTKDEYHVFKNYALLKKVDGEWQFLSMLILDKSAYPMSVGPFMHIAR